MDFLRSFLQDWFDLLNAFGIIASFWLAIMAFRSEAETRKISNLLAVTANHRDTWKIVIENPSLHGVLKSSRDLNHQPVTLEEELFVLVVIQHCHSVFQASKTHLLLKPEGFERDLGSFFSLPVSSFVWERIKHLQNADFVTFIESTRLGSESLNENK